MSQKREFDLAITARKAVHKPEFVRQLSLAVDKQRSVSYNSRPSSFLAVQRYQDDSKLTRKIRDQESPLANSKNNFSKHLYNQRQVRILVLNLIDKLLQEYSIEESRFLRKPAVLVTCFLNSGFARELRREN